MTMHVLERSTKVGKQKMMFKIILLKIKNKNAD
jgi:hypothetical protein